MPKSYLLYFLSLLSSVCYSQDPILSWAKQTGAVGNDVGSATAIDASGNVYTTGIFINTVDFDPGPAVFNITSVSETVFISKLDANGNFLWAKTMVNGLNSTANVNSIALDQSGNIYIIGGASGTVDFDPGAGTFNLTGISPYIYISKFDMNGNFTWAKQFGGGADGGSVGGTSIAVDIAGNVYSCGTMVGTCDFDPGPSVFNLVAGTNNPAAYISKLDANGNLIWAKITNGGEVYTIRMSMAASGDLVLSGNFHDMVDFDPGPSSFNLDATSSNASNAYMLKLSSAGNFIWAKQFAGGLNQSNTVATDLTGNIYVSGTFENIVDFDPGAGIYNLDASIGYGYITKLNNNGNFVWAKQWNNISFTEISAMTLDAAGNLYYAITFAGSIDLDPGPDVYPVNTSGPQQMAICKLDQTGNLDWALLMQGIGNLHVSDLELDAAERIYATGYFFGYYDFDPGLPNLTFSSTSSLSDVFIQKFTPCINTSTNLITTVSCSSYLLNGQTYTSSGSYIQTLTNAAGCDSIITLNLTINRIINSTIATATACDTYLWNGQPYTETGIYNDTLLTASGCDSIVSLDLTINKRSVIVINKKICTGESFEGHTTPGTYTNTFIAANGCDSTRTLNLTVGEDKVATIDTAICPGKNYNGHTIAGTYTDILISVDGCDSINTVHLTVKSNCNPFLIPNSFTPNGDTDNDIFRPVITVALKTYSFIIFDRFGQKIFETRNYPGGWDGTYKGRNQPTGSYVYYIRYSTANGFPVEEKGTFLLFR